MLYLAAAGVEPASENALPSALHALTAHNPTNGLVDQKYTQFGCIGSVSFVA